MFMWHHPDSENINWLVISIPVHYLCIEHHYMGNNFQFSGTHWEEEGMYVSYILAIAE